MLGTVLDFHVTTTRCSDGPRAERVLLDEIDRLEDLFSAYRPSSEFARWRTGAIDEVSPELSALLRQSLRWQERTNGIYNPGIGRLTQRWAAASASGVEPSDEELLLLATSVHDAPYGFGPDGRIQRRGDCTALNLNAFAKGVVVDRATDAVRKNASVERVVVNIGGELVHAGTGSLVVGIEDPARPHDNAAPLQRVRVSNAALATSGSARRSVQVGGRWASHVIDPRTGIPVAHVASASVIAADAGTADILATVLSVLEPVEGLAVCESLVPSTPAFVVDIGGTTFASKAWTALAL